MSYLICIAAFGLLWAVNKRDKMKRWWIVAGLCLIGAGAFANTELGGWVATHVLGWVISIPAGWFNVGAAVLATIILLILAVVIGYDIAKDHKTDKAALGGLVAVPLVALIAVGPLAGGATTLFDAIANFGSNGVSTLVSGS